MKIRTSLIGLLVVCGIGVCSIGTAAAQPAAPPAGYKIEEKYTQKSPDGAITIEQYENKETDDYKWQFWVRRQGAFTQLDPELADYPAGFRFTNDLKWLVRMQKTGSGESTLYLYRLGPQGFVPATKKPLGDLAWAYFKSRPEWRKVKKDPEYHISANLLKGTEGCGQLLMFLKDGNTILVDFLPELVPPVFGEDEGSQAEDDLSALWGPAHSRATQPLFDQSFACGLCDA